MQSVPHSLTAARPAGALRGSVRVPGDRGISHRALIVASLAVGETRITGLQEASDIQCTAAAMRALGAAVVQDAPGQWRVIGRGVGGLREPADVLDMGSGTAAHLLCGVLSSHDLFAVLTGDASLRSRSMRQVTDPLEACGARFITGGSGRLPLAIQGARDALPLDCTLPIASAAVKSALLLAGLNAPGWTRVEEPMPTHDHSERMLRHFGAELRVEQAGAGRTVRLMGQPELMAADLTVPGDPSLAAFPLVAALLTPGSEVTVRGVGLNPLRTGLFAALREMGARLAVSYEQVEGGEPVGNVTAAYTGLRGADISAEWAASTIDEQPILAVAAACATGTTRLRGWAEQSMPPTGRLAAAVALLTANGIRAEVEGNDLVVQGGSAPPPDGGVVATHGDDRIAMSALILGLATQMPVSIDDGASIDASFPGFAPLMRGLGGMIA